VDGVVFVLASFISISTYFNILSAKLVILNRILSKTLHNKEFAETCKICCDELFQWFSNVTLKSSNVTLKSSLVGLLLNENVFVYIASA
jgi:hypothetical protein